MVFSLESARVNPQMEFSKGDPVIVKNGRHDGEIGRVEAVSAEYLRAWHFDLVWVRLSADHVDGFQPDHLQKLRKRSE
jgi:ribosomal protein S4E